MAQVREGHTLVLLGATITHARQQQLGPTQHTSPGAGPTSPQGASAAGPPAVAAAHRMSCTDSASATPQHTPALTTNTTSTATIAWVEADAGSELFSLTAMPGCLTTPPLVSYTSLAAVVLSYSLMPYAGHGAVAHIASAVQPLAGNGGIVSGACHGDGDTWPCRQLQALAAATCQLPDASLGWARDTPFLQRRFGGSTASCGAGAGQQQQNTPGASGIGSQCVQPLGPDSACGSLACVVVVRSADVATHRVHRWAINCRLLYSSMCERAQMPYRVGLPTAFALQTHIPPQVPVGKDCGVYAPAGARCGLHAGTAAGPWFGRP